VLTPGLLDTRRASAARSIATTITLSLFLSLVRKKQSKAKQSQAKQSKAKQKKKKKKKNKKKIKEKK
jgi:uncharacterized membrane protein YheB (UPF0754 family)